jgi:hypothetical protein
MFGFVIGIGFVFSSPFGLSAGEDKFALLFWYFISKTRKKMPLFGGFVSWILYKVSES